ncbi:uncharacterized protein LOC113272081 [Papaver somniferum]|uniref:uncharacterized protein LOC113272081 n=1 Tax=Papaver somniferum TaxID=3469 RepID=UPI000E6FAC03|nr:uncharacterized protein LOC113272081 [Papaver somniferum]
MERCLWLKVDIFVVNLGHSKQESFKGIEENFQNKYTSWSSTSLTQAGRGTMMKYVLNSIPIYQMSTFKIPTQVLNKLTSIQRKFFWGYKSNRGLNPIGWNKVCKPKELGGMAFRYLEKLNLALLTKLAWRLLNEKNALYTQIMENKYFKKNNILHQKIEAKNGSCIWNRITNGLAIIQQHYFMEVNNGKKTKIWLDGFQVILNPPIPMNDLHRFYQDVKELLLPNLNSWNVDLLKKLFDQTSSQQIQGIFMDLIKEDVMIWSPCRDGKFTVKSA